MAAIALAAALRCSSFSSFSGGSTTSGSADFALRCLPLPPGRLLVGIALASLLDRLGVHEHAAATAGRADLAERLQQAFADPLASHLAPGRVEVTSATWWLRPVAAETLGEPAQHELTVALEHHVDEVDDDDAADVAQPQLPHDLLGGLRGCCE